MVRFDFVVDEDMELYLMEVSCYARNYLLFKRIEVYLNSITIAVIYL